ncbi:hypothetical protein, partial [Streptomyces sp. NPDC001948]
PDALLALLMTVTVYCVLRAMERGRTKWLVWAAPPSDDRRHRLLPTVGASTPEGHHTSPVTCDF